MSFCSRSPFVVQYKENAAGFIIISGEGTDAELQKCLNCGMTVGRGHSADEPYNSVTDRSRVRQTHKKNHCRHPCSINRTKILLKARHVPVDEDAMPPPTPLSMSELCAEVDRLTLELEALRAAQSMLSLQPAAPPVAEPRGPATGELITLHGSSDVHRVVSVDSSVGAPYYQLSGMPGMLTLAPSAGGSRWSPVDATSAAVPVTLLDRFKVVVWVINLRKSPRRLANVTALLPSHLAWSRSDAVDGRTLNWPALARDGYVTDAAAQLGDQNLPTICRSSNSFSPHLNLGAVGCARSHLERWLALANSNYRFAVILEDDIDMISPDFCHALSQILQRKPDLEFCYLGSHECLRTVKAAGARVQLRDLQEETVSGLFGYVISRAAADRLSGSVFPLSEQIDIALNRLPWGLGKRCAVAFDAPLVMAPPSHDDSEVQTVGENAFASLPPVFARQVVAGEVDRAEPRQTAVVRIELSLKDNPEVLSHWSLFRRDAGPLGVELATMAEIGPTAILSLCNGVFMVCASPHQQPPIFHVYSCPCLDCRACKRSRTLRTAVHGCASFVSKLARALSSSETPESPFGSAPTRRSTGKKDITSG